MKFITPKKLHKLEVKHNKNIANIENSPITDEDIDLAFYEIQEGFDNKLASKLSNLIEEEFDTEEVPEIPDAFTNIRLKLFLELDIEKAKEYYDFLLSVVAHAHNTNVLNNRKFNK